MQRKSSFSREDLLASSQGELFGPESGRLPAPPMLMADRITHISEEGGEYGKGQIIAELDITPDLWFFECHFPGDPVMPGCLGLDALWQFTGFFLTWLGHKGKGRALGVEDVKFTGQILPTAKKVTYQLDVKRIISRKLTMIISDGQVSVDGKVIYTARNLRVGLFDSEQIAAL